MKKKLKWIFIAASAVILLLQLFNPAHTNPPVKNDFVKSTAPPENVAALFRAACHDCHSHETRWPWYSYIAPISWGVVGDVNRARVALDLSMWPADDADKTTRKLEAMADEIQSESMPLPKYLLLHRDARLTKSQRQEMADWLAPLAAKTNVPSSSTAASFPIQGDSSPGRALFLKNCAHCHGANARGNEGPDLHKLDWTDAQIATRIRNGKKGQMTAFEGKLQPAEIDAVILYLRTLK